MTLILVKHRKNRRLIYTKTFKNRVENEELELIFDLKVGLVFWFEVFVGASVLVEDPFSGVTHYRILGFVSAFKYII